MFRRRPILGSYSLLVLFLSVSMSSVLDDFEDLSFPLVSERTTPKVSESSPSSTISRLDRIYAEVNKMFWTDPEFFV